VITITHKHCRPIITRTEYKVAVSQETDIRPTAYFRVYTDIFERPFVRMLSDRCLSCLSVTLVYCGQTVG